MACVPAIFGGLPAGISSREELATVAIRTDNLLLQLKTELAAGEHAWVHGGRLQDRHSAFLPLTHTLKELRNCVIALVREVRVWQGLPKEPAWHAGKSLEDVSNPEDAPDSSPESETELHNPMDGCDDSHVDVPPFIWNGIVYLPALIEALNPLSRSQQLRRWFGPEYPFEANPLSLPWSLKEHPNTPGPVQSWVRVAGTVEKRVVPEKLRHHKEAVAQRRRWREAFTVTKGPIDMASLLRPQENLLDAELRKRQ